MAKRKSLSPKIRFEVFKRDRFTCQYCGSKAPDALLEVDHVVPVAEGGADDFLNLLTSCKTCNGGKGARRIGDHAEMSRQHARLAELAERREQMKAMLEWREELSALRDEQVDVCDNAMQAFAPRFCLNESGRHTVSRHIEKYGLDEVLDAIEIAFRRYYEDEDDASWEVAFQKLGGVLRIRRDQKTNPARARAYYIRGILRNRGLYSAQAVQVVEAAASWGVDLDEIERLAKTSRNWTIFRCGVSDLIAVAQEEDNG